MDVDGNVLYFTGKKLEDACPAEQRDGPDTDNDDPDVAEMPRHTATGRCVWEFEGGMDVPPPAQDYPPTPPDDATLEPPDSPQDTMSRPWPQTRWCGDHSPTDRQGSGACPEIPPDGAVVANPTTQNSGVTCVSGNSAG
jgi:hypothetical protein